MANRKGWVKLWRKTQNSDMYKSLNSKQRDVMINILMLANHEEKTWEWQGELHTCKPGQFKTSLSSLQDVCADDVSIQNIRTAIKKLEKWEFLTNESTKSGRVITVNHWEDYQVNGGGTNKDANKEVTKDQQRGNKEVTTNKNVKNDKNEKNDKEVSVEGDSTRSSQDDKENDPKFGKETEVYKLTKRLRDRITDWYDPVPPNVPDTDSPENSGMQKWCKDMDRLIRLGTIGGKKKGPDPEQVKYIIRWIFDKDDFWRDTIQSPHGIRNNLSQIAAQIRKYRRKKSGRGKLNGKSEGEYIDELLEEV